MVYTKYLKESCWYNGSVLINISPLNPFPNMLLPIKVHINYETAFGTASTSGLVSEHLLLSEGSGGQE